MGNIIVTEFMTLDGVGQAPGAPARTPTAGADGGWQAPLLDEASGAVLFEQAARMDALLLGRRTYDIFAAYWPHAPAEIPFTELLNRVPKYVATRTLEDPLAWSGSSVVGGDLAAGVAALKQRHERSTSSAAWISSRRCCARVSWIASTSGCTRSCSAPASRTRCRGRSDRAAAGPHRDLRRRHSTLSTTPREPRRTAT